MSENKEHEDLIAEARRWNDIIGNPIGRSAMTNGEVNLAVATIEAALTAAEIALSPVPVTLTPTEPDGSLWRLVKRIEEQAMEAFSERDDDRTWTSIFDEMLLAARRSTPVETDTSSTPAEDVKVLREIRTMVASLASKAYHVDTHGSNGHPAPESTAEVLREFDRIAARRSPVETEENWETVWLEGLEHDDEFEYTSSSDCDGSNERRWKRAPEQRAFRPAGPWVPVTEEKKP